MTNTKIDIKDISIKKNTNSVGFSAWYATVVFALLYWLSILDRFIITLLVEPIKRDLGISDVQFAILHGAAFTLSFAVIGLLAGALADRFNRRWIIFGCVTIWSLATAVCGMVQNFMQLIVARLGVGAGETGLNPCATSIIADLFPRERLTLAMAVYAMGSTLGSGCAYLVGGKIVEWASKLDVVAIPIIGQIHPWQAVFFIVGIPGILLALLAFTVPEPTRRTKPAPSSNFWSGAVSSYLSLGKFIRQRNRFFLFHYAGFGAAMIVTVGAGAWYPAHLMRSFGWSSSEIGASLGLTLVTSGIVGKFICGLCVDALYRRGFKDAQLRWYAGCLLLATPIGVISATSGNPWVFLCGLWLFMVLLSPLPACAGTALNLVTPTELRGTGYALYALLTGILGASLGSILIAMASDHIFGGGASIGKGMALITGIFCPLAAILLACGFSAMRNEVQKVEREILG